MIAYIFLFTILFLFAIPFVFPPLKWKKWKVFLSSFLLFFLLWAKFSIDNAVYNCQGNGLAVALGLGLFWCWSSLCMIGFIGIFIFYMQSDKIPAPCQADVVKTIAAVAILLVVFLVLRNYLVQHGPCWVTGG